MSTHRYIAPEDPWVMPYRLGKIIHLYRECSDMSFAAYPYPSIESQEDRDRLIARGMTICDWCKEKANVDRRT